MPVALPDVPLSEVLALAALVAMLAVGFRGPSARVEVAATLACVAVVLAVGAVSGRTALDEVQRMLPVVAFLVASLIAAEACAAEGVFGYLGALISRGTPVRLLGVTFLVSALVTAVLSLDATVVMLTPVALAAARTAAVSRPLSMTCVRLANSASLMLPVSNLTNLLALPSTWLTFTGWFAVAALPWLAVLAVEYAGLRLLYADDLAGPARSTTPRPPAPAFALTVLALMLAGFVVCSPAGIAPFWPAAVAALVLAGHTLRDERARPAQLLTGAQLPFAAYALGLAVVVAAVAHGVVGDAVTHVVDALPAGDLLRLLAIAALATGLANLANNLPAALLLLPLIAPLGTPAILAALVGLDAGAGLTLTGSLANLLWRRTLTGRPDRPSLTRFHLHGALVTPIAVVAGVLAVHIETRLGWF